MGIASAQPKILVTALTEKENIVFCEVSLGNNNSAPLTYRCTHHSIGRPTLNVVSSVFGTGRYGTLESVENFEKTE